MRRVLLFVALLTLIGLSTAFAASFDVSSEDIATFSTDVSISVPTTTESNYFLGGDVNVLPGTLSTSTGGSTAGVRTSSLARNTGSVASPEPAGGFRSWQMEVPLTSPLVLNGPASLSVTLTGGGSDLAAALFWCAEASTATSACMQITNDSLGAPGSNNNEVVVNFGSVNETIPTGEVLRVQVINPGTKSWNIQWGYKDNRPSALQLTVVVP